MLLNVVFVGTPDFALPFLKALHEDTRFAITAVVTQEDKKVGRQQKLTPPPVKVLAETYQLPLLQPQKLKNNPEFLKLLKELAPDFIVVVAYGHIIPAELLELPTFGCINVHPSLLPKYRGATPIESALLNGDQETGIAFMKLDEQLDHGPIYMIQKVAIDPQDTAETLRLKLSLGGASLLNELLIDIAEGGLQPFPQNESQVTFCRPLEREDGFIDPTKLSAIEIKNRLRAYTPWPQCYLLVKGKRLKILEAGIDLDHQAPPGSWNELGKNAVTLGTCQGLLIPTKVQLEGKNPMAIDVFLRGYRAWLFEPSS